MSCFLPRTRRNDGKGALANRSGAPDRSAPADRTAESGALVAGLLAPVLQELLALSRHFDSAVGGPPYGWEVDREPTLEDAIALAARAHRGQRYSSLETEPYIFHPLRIMLSLADPADQIAAVLHDAIEATDLELRDLAEAGYPTEIVAAVDSLSHRADESYDEYIDRVATNEIARRVKLADLRENLANNLRLPSSRANADRIDRYERALEHLGGELRARPLFVVVSGPPASGKSTLAPVLARELGLPLIAKDTIKDALMSVLPVPDVDTSRQVGRGALSAMLAVAADSPIGAVIESNFYRSAAVDSVSRLPGSVIESSAVAIKLLRTPDIETELAPAMPGTSTLSARLTNCGTTRSRGRWWADGLCCSSTRMCPST